MAYTEICAVSSACQTSHLNLSHTSMVFKKQGTKTVTKSSRNMLIVELRLAVGPDLQFCQCSSGCFTSCCSQMGTSYFSGVQLFRTKEVLWLLPAATYAWRAALEHSSAEQSAGSSAICRLRKVHPHPQGVIRGVVILWVRRGTGSEHCVPSLEMNSLCLVLEHLGSKTSLTHVQQSARIDPGSAVP